MLGQSPRIGGLGEVFTDAPGVAGELREWKDDTYGYQVWRLVQNDTGADLPAYRVCDYDAGSTLLVGLGAADTPKIRAAGCLQRILPDGYYGWALCYGKGLGQADAAVAADAPLIVKTATAAGRVDDTAVAGLEHCIIGESKAAAAVAGDNFVCFFNML